VDILRRIVNPLRSRKVRLALCAIIVAFAREFGLNVSEETVLTIVGVIVALSVGIAIEDHGTKAAGGTPKPLNGGT
jgi:hypothetical protein